MKHTRVLLTGQILILAAAFFAAGSATAQEVQHLTVTRPGGFPGLPVMGDIQRTTNGVAVTWDGPSGYYQLYQKLGLTDKTWQKVGRPSLTRKATITSLQSNAFLKVQGPSPRYAGVATCAECHEDIHAKESYTRHAGAFSDALFVAKGGQTNAACLPCHTVGYGLPTGFVSKNDPNTNPRLAGVQCESCHGPAAAHAANEMDFTVRPRVELAGQVCGGCHTGAHHPTYDEWKTTGHFTVTEDMNPADRVNRCGRCHSGSSRLALINGENPAVAVTNDANVGITCVVCHDPHQNHVWTNVMTGLVYTNQLRQALSSTNDFFLSTSDNFTNKYNPNINLCAQCHNHRGASWTSTSRPPHHSPQYNMLLGTVGVLPDGVSGGPTAHAGTYFLEDDAGQLYLATNQCVTCHMQKAEYQPGPPEVAAATGHKFEVDTYGACAGCHGRGANAEGLTTLVRSIVSSQIQQVKASLDDWALNKAPDVLRTNYGELAWEYSVPGDLSVGTNSPPADRQSLIATNIMKARFNLYLVHYDGSHGVHNGPYALTLLDAARNWVQQELSK
ncbi:MAG: cytochrome c family protein [Verrucomicrobia bacterium]|jgi:hypothetical protein|nr:cytochrome c family protein [Verrucomicrobiota bacterium]